MPEDITLVFDEYTEQLLFCKYFIANKLNHNAEMGRCGENILIQELRDRFQMLEFVTGFVVVDRAQSPQCDILVCRKTMHRRQLEGGLFIVTPRDCLMVIEVKGNLSTTDFRDTITKNQFFKAHTETEHIKLALFAYRTNIAKSTLFEYFGYKYKRITKAYEGQDLGEPLLLDNFVCLHRSVPASDDRSKQFLFLKDGQEPLKYVLSIDYPITRSFFGLIEAMQD